MRKIHEMFQSKHKFIQLNDKNYISNNDKSVHDIGKMYVYY